MDRAMIFLNAKAAKHAQKNLLCDLCVLCG